MNARRSASLALLCTPTAAFVLPACSTSPPPDPTISCPIISTSCPSPPPSFAKDVEPLIQNYCVMCHSPGGTGEKFADLRTYTGVWMTRTEVQSQVYHCYMPNEDASPPPPTLTNAQRETIVAWVACNAPNN
jgi:hypothetical protein